jgi:hypothetical protein
MASVYVPVWHLRVQLFDHRFPSRFRQIDMVVGPSFAYSIDIFRDRSAEVMAATS